MGHKLLMLTVFCSQLFYWSLQIFDTPPDVQLSKFDWLAIYICSIAVVILAYQIFHIIARRMRGQPHPPLRLDEVEFSPDGVFHISEGTIGHIKWPSIKTITFEDDMYVLETCENGQTVEAVLTPWKLEGEERAEIETLLLRYLPSELISQLPKSQHIKST